MENAVGDVRRVLRAVVGRDVVDSLDDDEPFFDRGIVDSLHLVEIIDHIQHDLGIDVAGRDLSPENFGSISAMARFLERHRVGYP
jgi:acyl carrier protein